MQTFLLKVSISQTFLTINALKLEVIKSYLVFYTQLRYL